MAEDINTGLIANAIGGSGGSTDDVRKKLILAMLQQGTSGEPVQHWTQGLDRVGKALLGSLQLREMDRADAEFRRGEQQFQYRLHGVGGDGAAPPGAVPTSGPRPPGAPPLVNLPPMDEEPPRATVGTYATPKNLGPPPAPQPGDPGGPFPSRDPTQIAQALRGGGGANSGALPGGPGSPEDMGPELLAQIRQPPVADPSAPIVPNAVRTVSIPRPPPEQAFTGSQAPTGAMPPPLASPGSAVAPRPLTPPAPLAGQAAQAAPLAGMTSAQKREAIDRMLHPRTSAATRTMIQQALSPQWKLEVIGDKGYIFNPRTRELVEVADASKPTDDSKNLKEYNQRTGLNLTLPQFKALLEAEKETATLRAKSEFTKGEQRSRQEMIGSIVSQDVGRIIERVNKSNWPTTGAVGSALSGIGGTPPGDVADLLKGLQGHVATDTLQKMREASPTGASGFGALTQPELELIKTTYGSLHQRQSKEQFLFNLRRFERVYSATIHGGLEAGRNAANEGSGQQSGGATLQPGVYDWSPNGMKRR